MEIQHLSRGHIRRIVQAFLISMGLSGYLGAQVIVRDTIVIQELRERTIQSISSPIVTATFTYRGCYGNATISIGSDPCNGQYHDQALGTTVTGNRNGEYGIATLQFIANDPGPYGINVTTDFTCQTSTACDNTICIHGNWTIIEDDRGFRLSIEGAGGAYMSTYIPTCDPTDLQPQTLGDFSFEFIQDGESFSWIDAQGLSQSVPVFGCDYQKPPEPIVEVGKTIGFPPIPPGGSPSQQPFYKPLSDRLIEACQTTVDNVSVWKFKVGKVRIPIFKSICPRDGWTDLGHGTDGSLLDDFITDCTSYREIMNKLEYFIKGTHTPGNDDPGPNVYFSPAVVWHEKEHADNWIAEFKDKFNLQSFPQIFQQQVPTALVTCARDAVDQKSDIIDLYLGDGKILAQIQGIDIHKADLAAQEEYKKIQQHIRDWARQQVGWWNDYKVGCAEPQPH